MTDENASFKPACLMMENKLRDDEEFPTGLVDWTRYGLFYASHDVNILVLDVREPGEKFFIHWTRCNVELNQVIAEEVYKGTSNPPFFYSNHPHSHPLSTYIPVFVPKNFLRFSSCIPPSSFLPVLPWQSPTRFPSAMYHLVNQCAMRGHPYAATVSRRASISSLIVAFDVSLTIFLASLPLLE